MKHDDLDNIGYEVKGRPGGEGLFMFVVVVLFFFVLFLFHYFPNKVKNENQVNVCQCVVQGSAYVDVCPGSSQQRR